jgi:uncharacterized protein GlcG (DUF336 family)
MEISKWPVLIAVLVTASGASGAQPVINERTLSVDAALEIATTALANCRTHGTPVTITVLDHAARTKVVLRDDGANLHSTEHSLRKAYTALTYAMPSGEYGKRAAANPGSAGPLHLANITTAAGGVPIRAGNTVVGAIGISGTPGAKGGGAADEGCAQAGIDKVMKGVGG